MNKYLIILILFVIVFKSCLPFDPPSGGFEIYNYSDKAIYVYCTCMDSLPVSPRLNLFEKFNDLIIDPNGDTIDPIYSPEYRVDAYSTKGFVTWGSPENPRLYCDNTTVRLFFIKENVMRTHTWEEISQKQLYEKKTILTESQLSKNGWKYIYFPNQ